MSEPLPPPIRRRVRLGLAAGVVSVLVVLAACVVLAYDVVWTQAEADMLVRSQPAVTARALPADRVRLEGGREVALWHPLSPRTDVEPEGRRGTVKVVVFPGEDLAVLVDEVASADEATWQRVVDWTLFSLEDARAALVVALALAYGAVRLVLGFTPLALPALMRRRAGADAVLIDWRWTGRSSEAWLVARLGDETVHWRARLSRHGELRLGDTVRFVGHPRAGGWVVAWTPTATLRPSGPLHSPDAEPART